MVQQRSDLTAPLPACADAPTRLRLLTDAVTDCALFFLDADGRIVAWDAMAQRLFGYSEAEIVGQPAALLRRGEDSTSDDIELQMAAQQGRFRASRWLLRRDGVALWVSDTTTPIRDEAGRLHGFARVVQDRTEQKRGQDALRARERRFRVLAEHAWDGTLLVDAQGTILETPLANLLKALGYGEYELVGSNGFAMAHPDDVPVIQAALVQVLQGPNARASAQYRIRDKQGNWVWVEASGTNLLADPEIGAIVVNLRDLTGQRAAEQALRRTEARFSRLVESNVIGITIARSDGRILYANDAYLRLIGASRADFEQGRLSWRGVTPSGQLPNDERAMAEARARGACTPYEKEYIRPDGTHVPILLGFASVEEGFDEFICFVLDLSVQKQAVRRLHFLYELVTALTLATDPLASLDDLYRKLADEFDFEVYFNYLLEPDGVSLRLAHHRGIPEDIGHQIGRLEFGQALCGVGAAQTEPYVLSDVQGSDDPRAALARALGLTAYICEPLLAHGRLVGTLSFGTRQRAHFCADDLLLMQSFAGHIAVAIDRATLLRELNRRAEELADADRRKDEWLAMLAHELRNPLAPIVSSLHILKLQGSPGPLADQARATIERQTRHLTRLVDDLLDVARITSGKLQLQKSTVELTEVLAQAIETARPLIERRRHALEVVLPDERVQVDGDPVRLVQIFDNLLTNAAKYMAEGGRIRLAAAVDKPVVVVRVRDWGMGIPADMLPRVFELFTQLGGPGDHVPGGLGIGLALVRSLAEVHGGKVEVSSGGPGEGTEFRVCLPLTAPDEQGPTDSGLPGHAGYGRGPSSSRTATRRLNAQRS